MMQAILIAAECLAAYAGFIAVVMLLAHRLEVLTHAHVSPADPDRLDRVLGADREVLNSHAAPLASEAK